MWDVTGRNRLPLDLQLRELTSSDLIRLECGLVRSARAQVPTLNGRKVPSGTRCAISKVKMRLRHFCTLPPSLLSWRNATPSPFQRTV